MSDDDYMPVSDRVPIFPIHKSHAVLDSVAQDFATAASKLKWELQHMASDTQATKDAKTLMLATLRRFDNLNKKATQNERATDNTCRGVPNDPAREVLFTRSVESSALAVQIMRGEAKGANNE